MADIHHRLIMSAPADEVFAAVTREVFAGVSKKGVLACTTYDPDTQIVWKVLDGPVDWIVGTEIVIALDASPDGTGTVVRLTHRNWRDTDTDLMATHTTRWARMLLGLKKRVEMPDPTDTLA